MSSESKSVETPATEVVAVVKWLRRRNAVYQINGGWAVDALAGRQTRPHDDVDVFVDARHVDALLRWLEGRGYRIGVDWRPIRVELVAGTGRVDVHPMTVQRNGDGVQEGFDGTRFLHRASERVTGTIGDMPVTVASAETLLRLRTGYTPRPKDLHDIALLEQLLHGGD